MRASESSPRRAAAEMRGALRKDRLVLGPVRDVLAEERARPLREVSLLLTLTDCQLLATFGQKATLKR